MFAVIVALMLLAWKLIAWFDLVVAPLEADVARSPRA